jgi:two-component system response regulator HydG
VRELRNGIESMVIQARGSVLDARDVPPHIAAAQPSARNAAPIAAGISLDEAEHQLIEQTLRMTNGNREEAARILGIGARTLYRKLEKYQSGAHNAAGAEE